MVFPETLQHALDYHDPPWFPEDLSAELKRHNVIVKPPAIESWLQGEYSPRARILRAVADVLDMSMDDLYPSAPVTETTPAEG